MTPPKSANVVASFEGRLRPQPRALNHVHARANFQFRLARTPVGGSAKRTCDVVLATTAVVLLSPLLLAIAALVRLDSAGPSLFRQHRTGFRGRSFYVLKFRSMAHADGDLSVRQAERNDRRVTRLGRLLRNSSLDELPQLLNVISGDMSLVGPRPHAISHDRAFWVVDGEYPRRFLARPGITGLAQVRGERGLSDTAHKIRSRLRHDLDYIDNWSLPRDFGIMLRTARILIHDSNAY